jgi:uncharacterized coiled-coil DUF342 family protein
METAASTKGGAAGNIKRPDRAELQAKIDVITAEINALNERSKEAKAASEKIINDRSGSRGEFESARQVMQGLIAEKKLKMAEREELTNSRDASRDRVNAMMNNEKNMRAELKFSSVEAIDRQIRELEQRQSRTTMSLNDEKKLVKDIKALQLSKKTVAAVEELKVSIEREKSVRNALDISLNERNAELKILNDRLTAQKAILDNLNKDAADKDAIPALRRTQNECREKISEKYQAIRDLRAEFKKAEDAYAAQLAEINARKREQRQKEIEARAAEEALRKKQLEEEEAKRIPYEDEMNLCEHLITYLGKFKEEEVEATASSDSVAAAAGVFAGMKLLTRGDDDYAVLGKKKEKAPKKKSGASAKKDIISHSMDTLDSFSLLQIDPPTTLSQVAAAVEALRAKKASFQGLPRGAVPTIAEQLRARQAAATAASGGNGGSKKQAKAFALEDFPTLTAAAPKADA